jgi:alpha-L-fucosidase
LTDYDIMNSPFHRDILRELSDACRKEGIQFSTYYSICDWYHPAYPLGSPGGSTKKPNPDMPGYITFMKGQLREIITSYGPLGVLWFDGEWEKPWTHEAGLDLYEYVRSLQPGILVNNRVDKGRKGMQGITVSDEFVGDFDTPEQQVGTFNRKRLWESCITIGRQWAWKPDDELKSTAECLHTLLQVVGGDGNFLFNVGPMPDGRIEPRQIEKLQAMGDWLDKYGEGVYGTRGGPYMPGTWGASTCKGNRIYLYVWGWPENHQLQLPLPGLEVLRTDIVSDHQIEISKKGTILLIRRDPRNEVGEITVVRLTIAGEAFEIRPLRVEAGAN